MSRSAATAAAVTVAAVAAIGAVFGLLLPRGPLTAGQGLTAMAVSVVVGLAAGAATRSRWTMLLAPVTFAAAYEIARIDAIGPVVDAPQLEHALGILALLLGRGVDALLMLVPMSVGAAYGAGAARRSAREGVAPTGRRGWRLARQGFTGVVAVALAALAVAVARPASTAPIVDADGRPLDGSIAELATVELGGREQAVMIRGQRADAPVLLWLAGGPGGSDVGPMRNLGERLEEAFVVVTWDQRGSGASYASIDPTDELTPEQAVADTLELTDLLRERFGQETIVIAGNSWGTVPAVLAVHRHPERFRAYVGAGQMVDLQATDRMFYDDTLRYARSEGDTELEATLLGLGPPPYEDFLDYYPGVFGGEPLWNVYPTAPGYGSRGEMPANILAREFTLVEGLRSGAAAIDTLGVLYPRAQEIDLRVDAPTLEVPVVLVQGAHEARGRVEPAEAWFEQLVAPSKQLVTFERSGHRPMFEEPERFFDVMVEVLEATGDGR